MTREDVRGETSAQRIEKLRSVLSASGSDAFIIADPVDLKYFTGFTGSNGMLAVGLDWVSFFTDPRYDIQARIETCGMGVEVSREFDTLCTKEVAARSAVRVGLCADSVTHALWGRLQSMMPEASFSDVSSGVRGIRQIKSEAEIGSMREASRLAEEAFRAVVGMIRPGVTERDVAVAYHVEVLRRGADGISFDTIVAAGERGALPHASPGNREFKDGDLVVFDFGVRLDGYCSDQTLTLPVGRVEGEAAEVYGAVLKALRAGIGKVKPGVELCEIDSAARGVIEESGYGPFFGHGTGHGIGLCVHEAPTVAPKSKTEAQEGMVFTVEPGIYLADRFGVRIEDTIVVRAGGAEPITMLDKEFGAFRP